MNRADSPAFPRPISQDPTGKYPAQDGATLREYLTGQALVGVLAINAGGNPDYELVASHAVALADLTLIALDDVSHEDAVKRIKVLDALAQESVDSMEKEQEQEGEKDPATGDGTTPPEAAAPTSETAEGKPAKTDQKDPAAKSDGKKTGKAKA